MTEMSIPEAVAREAWGPEIPAWVLDLAQVCALTSQSRVAAKMDYSPTVISSVLRAKYTGNLATIEEVFNGAFNGVVVDCPALGTMPANECRKWRDRSTTFVVGNPMKRDMYRACNRCARNGKGAEA